MNAAESEYLTLLAVASLSRHCTERTERSLRLAVPLPTSKHVHAQCIGKAKVSLLLSSPELCFPWGSEVVAQQGSVQSSRSFGSL